MNGVCDIFVCVRGYEENVEKKNGAFYNDDKIRLARFVCEIINPRARFNGSSSSCSVHVVQYIDIPYTARAETRPENTMELVHRFHTNVAVRQQSADLYRLQHDITLQERSRSRQQLEA